MRFVVKDGVWMYADMSVRASIHQTISWAFRKTDRITLTMQRGRGKAS